MSLQIEKLERLKEAIKNERFTFGFQFDIDFDDITDELEKALLETDSALDSLRRVLR